MALQLAMAEIGLGEVGSNNAGPHVKKYTHGTEGIPWCAAFVSYCYEEAWAKQCGEQNWGSLSNEKRKNCPISRSHGAKRLWRKFSPVSVPQRGDVACWHRGAKNAATGHIGIVSLVGTDGVFFTVEGNRGGYPSKVSEFKHVLGEGNLIGFGRVKT